MEAKFVEKYNGWDIYENTDGSFVIYGYYKDKEIKVAEDTIEDIKKLIDFL